ncbi:hypothetical protein [uncultured Psychroserpens sp.]|uniref:hypothetical protein n=1 Tax=uncultured Psychroserpens sp. TaxID=255436 RepID=UPI0026392B8A|nr:hypothetical protein [uncultured Psychroserpens sp.]
MKQFVLLFLSLTTFLSCQDSESQKPLTLTQEKPQTPLSFSNVTLIDKFKDELVLDTLSSSKTANFSALYMGSLSDSIVINYRNADQNHLVRVWEKHRTPSKDELSIYIDTTKHIGSPTDYTSWREISSIAPHRALSYPIFIRNHSKDTLRIGFGDYFPMITEAKDSTGLWIPIQERFIYMCGTGVPSIVLAPNEIALTSIKKGCAKQYTKLRIRFELYNEQDIYSNEINAAVNHD